MVRVPALTHKLLHFSALVLYIISITDPRSVGGLAWLVSSRTWQMLASTMQKASRV